MGKSGPSPYEVLGVPENSNLETIKKAYKKLALKHHPDKNPDDPKGAKERFQQLQDAYEKVNTPEKQKQFNESSKSKSKDMDGQREQYKDGQQQKVKAIENGPKPPQPWKKGVTPPKPQQPAAPRPNAPGPQMAKQNNLQGAQNRQRQSPQQPQQPMQGPGANAERPQMSKLDAIEQLLGMTKFGRKIQAKADKIRQFMDIAKALFGSKRNRQQSYDPSMQQRQAQFAQRFDQQKAEHVQQMAGKQQSLNKPGAPKPQIGWQRSAPKPSIEGPTAKAKPSIGKGKETPKLEAPPKPAPKVATPGQKQLTGPEHDKAKKKTIEKSPSMDI